MRQKPNNILEETERQVQKALKAHGRYFRSRRLEKENSTRPTGKGRASPRRQEAADAAQVQTTRSADTARSRKSGSRPVALLAGKGYLLFNILLIALFLGGSGYLIFLIMTNLK